MAITITKTIGSGGDYATVAAWWAAIPASLVAADEVHIGQLLDQEHTAALPDFTGKTVDGTRYIELTTAPGASWTDNSSNPTRYGYGARISGASQFGVILKVSSGQLIRFRKFQLRNTDTGTAMDIGPGYGGGAPNIEQVLVEAPTAGNTACVVFLGPSGNIRNNVFLHTGGDMTGATAIAFSRSNMFGCTIANIAGSANYGIISEYMTGQVLKDCAIFGEGMNAVGGSSTYAASGCATNQTSPPTGFIQTAFATASGARFANISVGTHNLKTTTGSSLIGAGVQDLTNLPTDAYGTTRKNPPDIGAYESPPVADTTPPVITNLTATAGTAQISGGFTSDEAGTAFLKVSGSGTPEAIPAPPSSVSGYASGSMVAGANSYNLTGLAPGVYYVHLARQDAVPNRGTTSIVAGPVTVLDTTAPTQTGNLVVDQITDSGARLTLPAGADDVGVTGYQYRLNGGAWVDIASGGRIVTLTGLSSSTSYTPEGRCRDAAGNFSTPPVVSSPVSFSTLAPSGASVSVPLFTDDAGTIPAANLTNLKYAFWENATPDLIAAAPFRKGAAGATNAGGVFSLSVAGTALLVGQIGYLVVTNSDGTTGQSGVRAFAGPVVVS